ncbi:flavodoxin [Phocaeicola barnesiae]|uniref:flavodoxin n=1 Tax=Phocaeicola barnesiae TaxID=376804 RepID=UPI0025A40A69|nr:flavodoxin [Phocaeicola barnesiae]MDM8242787.1 flavodoxin [Phocaeicola barnesiae]
MKKLFYILLAAGLFFGFTSCEDDEPVTDQPQTETPENGGEDDENGNNDPENPNPVEGDILVVYYSFTNNTHTIVTDLLTQIDADVVRVEPAEKGLDYAANNYAIGSALIAAIRENLNDASSYPAIDPVDVELENYATVIVAAPLWWSNMAAPLQTFLFNHGSEMAGKNIGLIVSSASSGISGVEADAKRLIPEGNFLTPSLWIRSSQTSNCHEMTAEWLKDTGLIE